jgi:hypothetical protein
MSAFIRISIATYDCSARIMPQAIPELTAVSNAMEKVLNMDGLPLGELGILSSTAGPDGAGPDIEPMPPELDV